MGGVGESLEKTTLTAGLKADVPDLRGFPTKYTLPSFLPPP